MAIIRFRKVMTNEKNKQIIDCHSIFFLFCIFCNFILFLISEFESTCPSGKSLSNFSASGFRRTAKYNSLSIYNEVDCSRPARNFISLKL